MTRDEWIDEVLKPWKEGDVTQRRRVGFQPLVDWEDYSRFDPIDQCPQLRQGYEYRIKPRVVRWYIDTPQYVVKEHFRDIAAFLKMSAAANLGRGYTPEFRDAIRNAKPLQEKTNG